MSSENPHPGTPRPDDPKPQSEQPEPLLGDWIGPEEVGPSPGPGQHDPEPIPEDPLFAELAPESAEVVDLQGSETPPPASTPGPHARGDAGERTQKMDRPDSGPDSGSDLGERTEEIDLPPEESGGLPRPRPPYRRSTEEVHLSSESFEALADLPPAEPGSGWLEVTPAAGSAAEAPPEGSSDVLSAPPPGEPTPDGSDVLGTVATPQPGGSSLFDGAPGSSRFEDPGDPTEQVTEIKPKPPAEELYADLAEPLQPSSSLLDEDESPAPTPAADAPAAQAEEDLSEWLDPGLRRGSDDVINLDAGKDKPSQSGVNLLSPENPDDSGIYAASASSIFGAPRTGDGSDLDVAALPLEPDEDDATESIHLPSGHDELAGPRSDIFQQGSAQPAAPSDTGDVVSFDLPGAPPRTVGPDADAREQASGLIDWSLPVEGSDIHLSSEMTGNQADAAGIPDLRALAGETPPVVPVAATQANRVPGTRAPSTVPEFDDPAARTVPPAPSSRTRPPSAADRTVPRPGGSRLGWVVAGLAGLVVGAGGFAGAYYTGLFPSAAAPIRNQNSVTGPQPSAAAIDGQARAFIESGEANEALRTYDMAAPSDSPVRKAGHGQAVWLFRLQRAAQRNQRLTANDPDLTVASKELREVVDAADNLKPGEERQAGVRAALHLGLIKETTGDAAGAEAVYTEAAAKFPEARQVFDTAKTRMRLTHPGGRQVGLLAPQQADELARAAVVALLLLQGAPDGANPGGDEAGFLFWEAVNQATAGNYNQAMGELARARAAHDKRRLALAGRGLNPLSDPLEQIFPHCCDEMREYWALKRDLYENPKLGPIVRKSGVNGLAAAVGGLSGDEAKKFQAEIRDKTEQVKTLQTKAADLQAQLTESGKKLKTAQDEATQAGKDKEAFAKRLVDAQKEIDARSAQLTAANTKLADAQKREKAADDALAGVVKELKAVKLIDEKDDGPAALAKLPEVLRKASATAASADARKAAEALLQARKELDAAQAEAKTAREAADKAEARVKQAVENADKAVAAAKAETKEAVAAARASAQKKLDEVTAALTKAQSEVATQKAESDRALKQAEQEYAAKLEAKEEDFRRRLADAQAGVVIPLASSEQAARERAATEFSTGVELYFTGRYADAEATLERATRDDGADARYWYYLGLARYAQGKSADAAFKRGAELEARNQPNRRQVTAALERVQGYARQVLAAYRP